MPSFDVISKINYQEFDNALANCLREISNRYDFKGLNISIERKDGFVLTQELCSLSKADICQSGILRFTIRSPLF
jgi:uncharacterized protein YajQ (UPF0234 family)